MDLRAAIAYGEKELDATIDAIDELEERMNSKVYRDSWSDRSRLSDLERRQEFFNFILPKLREETRWIFPTSTHLTNSSPLPNKYGKIRYASATGGKEAENEKWRAVIEEDACFYDNEDLEGL